MRFKRFRIFFCSKKFKQNVFNIYYFFVQFFFNFLLRLSLFFMVVFSFDLLVFQLDLLLF